MNKTVNLEHLHIDERQFIYTVRRLADSLMFGSDPSPFLGPGLEYLQSRPYVAGDSVKTIDWRITARTGKLHVKEYEVPKQVPVYILIDTSASMCVSSLRVSKYAWAVMLGAALGIAAQERLSPAGILGCGERNIHLRPTLSRNRILSLASHLRRHNFTEETTLGKNITQLAPSLPNRSLIMVLSDLHDTEAVEAIKLIGQKHDCVALQLKDPAESGSLGGGIFRGTEAETGRSFTGHGRKSWIKDYSVAKDLRLGGVDHIELKTDEVFLPKLIDFLKRRDSIGRHDS